MPWVVASLVSAFFLGCYELCTKHAVRENAVLPVLFFANVCSASVWLALMAVHASTPGAIAPLFQVSALSGTQHLLLLLKSTIVAGSWICSYFAVKHLPVSLASPIRATGPIWTLVGALLVLGEDRPGWKSWELGPRWLPSWGCRWLGQRREFTFTATVGLAGWWLALCWGR